MLQAGHLALPYWSAYNCSKAGLDILTDCLRYELAAQGIPVVLVKPGPVLTPIWQKSRQRSQAAFEGMPPAAQQLYGPSMDKVGACCIRMEVAACTVLLLHPAMLQLLAPSLPAVGLASLAPLRCWLTPPPPPLPQSLAHCCCN